MILMCIYTGNRSRKCVARAVTEEGERLYIKSDSEVQVEVMTPSQFEEMFKSLGRAAPEKGETLRFEM